REQIVRACELGADRIELYTESYARAYEQGDVDRIFEHYYTAAQEAVRLGLGVNAGHDLNLDNLGKFCTIPDILEVSIGHALISDALMIGLSKAVNVYCSALTHSGSSG
ncbi:pyridoxine 5'-phosphate synthase, partial [Thermodesulfobacteriota bacterium]